MNSDTSDREQSVHQQLAVEIAGCFSELPQVEAVALSGSRGRGAGRTDTASDIDLYVYTSGSVPLESRRAIVARTGGASVANLDLNYWGAGDEWFNTPTGIEVDIVYFEARWMEEQIARVIDRHEASLGFSTCFWHTIRQSAPLYDPKAWFAGLQERCQVEYPEPLRQNIVRLNHPVLRGVIPAYAHQLDKAVARRDLASINHRVAALLASYFDILLAANRLLHPGEKRMIDFAVHNCSMLPANFEADLEAVLLLSAAQVSELPKRVTALLDQLDEMLVQKEFSWVIKLSAEEARAERETTELQQRLLTFERQYHLTSEEFYRQYEAGMLGDSADFMEWSSFYDMWRSAQEYLNSMRRKA
ncbi:MAG: DUF4037 domain-containing protein [Anaerolineales bacterium]|nr:DUF4037 domain-containing protein [Anaerolineales bacterium]